MARAVDIRSRILDDIVDGTLPFGARIKIDELAGRYDVSHMPVRGALRQLAGEGLIQMEPGRGARLRPIDRAFVENLFATRNALEVMLARQAAQRATISLLERLHDIETELEDQIANADFATVLQRNQLFHQTINDSAGNKRAAELVGQNWFLVRALWRTVEYGVDRFSGVASDHRHIMEALTRRDVEAAGVLMGAHVIKAKFGLLARLFSKSHMDAEKAEKRVGRAA